MIYLHPRRSRRCRYYSLLILVSISTIFLFWFWYTPLGCALLSQWKSGIRCDQVKEPFDLLRHLGGNGPWIQSHGFADLSLPQACSVDQMHMLSRHAERYPTQNAGNRHLALLTKLNSSPRPPKGALKFLKNWSYFVDATNPEFENLTTSGPYGGTLQAYKSGVNVASRYSYLRGLDQNISFWSCSSPRDLETARHFARGFFGQHWDKNGAAILHVIEETPDRGGDTLTPGDTCLSYIEDKMYGHDQGYAELTKWQSVYTASIKSRLRNDIGDLDLTPLDIYGMMELCGFELLVRGHSPWCDVFTPEEWYDFEYGRDLLHFYRAGPGNQYAGTMGYLWLNATRTLLSDKSDTGVYLSFAHDGDIIPLIATMGILDEDSVLQTLPNDWNKKSRKWRTSDIVPMSGNVVLERVVCGDRGTSNRLPRYYVRLVINDGLFDLEPIVGASGLRLSTGLASFQQWVDMKGQKYGDFRKVCGLPEDAPAHITFLHQ